MYKVTIERTEKGERKRKEYQKLTDNDKAENQYGYVEAVLPYTDTVKVYEQQIEDMDVSAVIKAINKIG